MNPIQSWFQEAPLALQIWNKLLGSKPKWVESSMFGLYNLELTLGAQSVDLTRQTWRILIRARHARDKYGKCSCTGYSFWDRLRNFLHKFTRIELSVHKLTNWVNSGKFMDNCWISCQVMSDMKKVYDDLIIINLYEALENWE